MQKIKNVIKFHNKNGKHIDFFGVFKNNEYLYKCTFGDYDLNNLHALFSVTKAITSMIALKASEETGISLETPILHHLDIKVSDSRFNTISVDDFLNMRSGIQWEEIDQFNNPDNPFQHFIKSDNPMMYLFNRYIEYAPNVHFAYNSALTHALVYWIEAVMQTDFETLVNEWLFCPMNISIYHWECDVNNKPYGGHGLYLRGEDFLKFSEVFMYGRYKDKVLLTPYLKNIFHSMTSQNIRGYSGYGYGMWHGEVKGHDFIGAFGHGGQRIYCFMQEETTFLFLGQTKPEFGIQEKIIGEYFKTLK